MKKKLLTVAFCLSLFACQSQPTLLPVVRQNAPLNLRQQSANPAQLPISAALRAELQQPDTEPEPREDYDQETVRKLLGVSYIKAHSFYFQTMDNGKSSIESILAHDGYLQTAQLVRHWQDQLGPDAVWPDSQSTTYKGPWPALEHAELKGGKGWFGLRSAGSKADEYYQRALDSWKRDLAPDHPEQAESWGWLARSAHFLHDVTVPFHTMSLVRPAQLLHHTQYEKTCDDLFENYLPSRNYNPQGVWQNGPYPASGNWGIYYPKGTRAKQIIQMAADEARPFYKLVSRPDRPAEANWDKTRAVMLPFAAKTTAGLFVNFMHDVGLTP